MVIRPLLPTDGENFRSILEDTNEDDRYCRFFHHIDHFDPHFVEQQINSRAEMLGFIAERDHAPLGIAHVFFLDEERAELAVLVARSARRQGVASALIAHAFRAVAFSGRREVVAYALSENAALAHLARKAGMQSVGVASPVSKWFAQV